METKSLSSKNIENKSEKLATLFGKKNKSTDVQNLTAMFDLDPNRKRNKPVKNVSESERLSSLFDLNVQKSSKEKLANMFGLDPNRKKKIDATTSQKLASLFDISPKTKDDSIMHKVTDILKSETQEKTKIDNLVKTYGLSFISDWLSTNWKPILWNIAYATATAIAIACAYIFITSSSWFILLSVLKEFGTTAIPGVLLSAIKKTGIDIGMNTTISQLLSTAKRNASVKNILEKQVPEGYLKNVLNSLGCDTKSIKVEHIISNVVNNSLSFAGSMATGMSIGDFLFVRSVALIPTIATGGYTAVKKMVSSISDLKRNVETTVLSGKQNTQETIINETISTGNNKTITKEINIVQKTGEKVKENVESSVHIPIISEALKDNTKIAFAGTTAITLISLALTNNTSGIADIVKNLSGSIIEKGAIGAVNIVKESDLAKSIIINTLIDKIGINKVLEAFSDRLTSVDKEKITKWSEMVKNEKSEGLIHKIFRKISGGEYLDIKTLKGMSLDALAKKYKKLRPDQNIDKLKKLSSESLQKLIYEEQLANQQKLATLLSSAIATTLKTAVVTGTLQITKSAFSKIDEINKELENVEKEMLKQKTLDKTKFQTKADDPSIIKESSKAQAQKLKQEFREAQGKTKFQTVTEDPSIIKESSKAQANLRKQEFREAQAKAQLEEGMKLRQTSLDEGQLLKEASKAQAQKLKDQFRQTQTAQQIKNEEIKNNEIQHRLKKLEQIAEKHKLKNAAQLEDLAQKLGVVIINTQGTAFGIPPDSTLLNPELQRSLDFEFTPVAQKIALETAKASTSWIPIIGWAQSTINQINLNLDIVEQINNIKNVIDVVTTIKAGESVEEVMNSQEALKSLLKMRIPSISTIVEEIIKTDTLSAKHVVLQALKDKILYGWDDKTTAREIAKKFLGTGEYGQAVAEMIGESFLKMIF